ncbi:hypothetical protein GCM10009808_23080 [Microbacterium sediminicola]|uniref:HTH marR-type domain-containing protein n=1 Tax=Microbacterium sediminicola TaxID=415210 RepID=A0ABP4UG96_9MICO
MSVSDDGDQRDTMFVALAATLVDVTREMRLSASHTNPVFPLTQTQSQVMHFVHQNPGCAPSEIADANGLQRTNVSAALRELKERGYVTSERSVDDGRGIRIHSTVLADTNIARLRRAWGEHLADAWGGRDADGLASALRTLESIRDALGARRATKDFAPETAATRTAS